GDTDPAPLRFRSFIKSPQHAQGLQHSQDRQHLQRVCSLKNIKIPRETRKAFKNFNTCTHRETRNQEVTTCVTSAFISTVPRGTVRHSEKPSDFPTISSRMPTVPTVPHIFKNTPFTSDRRCLRSLVLHIFVLCTFAIRIRSVF